VRSVVNGNPGEVLTTFPTVSSPTALVISRRTPVTTEQVRIEVTYTGACTYEIQARAIYGGVSTDADGTPADSPYITNPSVTTLTLGAANAEGSHTFAAGTKKFLIKARSSGTLSVYYTPGSAHALTLSRHAFYAEDDLGATITVYFKSTVAGAVVELVSWT
jgi:hypothetical protein